MDFSLAIGVYLLGVVSGALVVLAAMTDRPAPDAGAAELDDIESRSRGLQ